MSKVPQKDVDQHLVSLNKFEASIKRVVERTFSLLNRDQSKYSFPTLIGIDVDYNGQANADSCITAFLNKFRSVHQNEFVRFVTDTLWSMETHNSDIFYTHDGPKQDFVDVMWTLHVLSDSQIEISVSVHDNPCRDKFLRDVTSITRRFIPYSFKDQEHDSIRKLMTSFCKKNSLINEISCIRENLHILFIPNANRTGFYPVPLYGMSYIDAKRRSRKAIVDLNQNKNVYYRLFPNVSNEQDIADLFYTYLSLIQANDKFGVSSKFTQDTYSLAEMLFSVYADASGMFESNHDLVLLDPIDPKRQLIEAYCYNMRDLSDIN